MRRAKRDTLSLYCLSETFQRPAPPSRISVWRLPPLSGHHLLHRYFFYGAFCSCSPTPSRLLSVWPLQRFGGFSLITAPSLPHSLPLLLSLLAPEIDMIPLIMERRDRSEVRFRGWGCWLPVGVTLSSTTTLLLYASVMMLRTHCVEYMFDGKHSCMIITYCNVLYKYRTVQ